MRFEQLNTLNAKRYTLNTKQKQDKEPAAPYLV